MTDTTPLSLVVMGLDPEEARELKAYSHLHSGCLEQAGVRIHLGDSTVPLPSRRTTAVVLRDPVDELWAGWKSTLRNGGTIRWHDHVVSARHDRPLERLLVSSGAIAASNDANVLAVSVEPRQAALPAVLATAGLPRCRCPHSATESLVSAPSDLEHLYYPVLTHWTQHWLSVEEPAVEPDRTALLLSEMHRMLDVRPCFEIAAQYESRFAQDRLGIYDQTSLEMLGDTLDERVAEAKGVLAGSCGPLLPPVLLAVMDYLARCQFQRSLARQRDSSLVFPAANHIDLLPITAPFLGLARTVARSLVIVGDRRTPAV